MAFLSGLTFSKQLMVAVLGLWLAGLLAAAVWFGPPYLPRSARSSLDKYTAPIMKQAGTPLKIVGVILMALPLPGTGGVIYILLGAKRWQAQNNVELGQVGEVRWLSLPGSDKTKWRTAGDMWARARTPLTRPDLDALLGRAVHVSFEVAAIEGDGIYWLLWLPDTRQLPGKRRQTAQDLAATLGNALSGYNPRVRVAKIADPVAKHLANSQAQMQWLELGLAAPGHYPIKTNFEADPMMALVSSILTDGNVPVAGFQLVVRPVGNWQAPGRGELSKLVQQQAETNAKLVGQAEKERRLAVEAKLDQFGFETLLRFYAIGSDPQALTYRLRAVQDALGQYQGLNAFRVVRKGSDPAVVLNRHFLTRLDPANVLNIGELAVLYHLPNAEWEPVAGIKWSPARVLPPAAAVIQGWVES